jgi:hypothetical protein
MPAALVVNAYPNGVDYTQRSEVISGNCVLTAQTYTPGGIALNWLAMTSNTTSGDKFLPLSNFPAPFKAAFWSEGNTVAGSFTYVWNKATGKLQIFVGGTELTAVAVTLTDVIAFEAWFTAAA